MNATRHIVAKTLRLVRQNDTTAGGVLNGVLRLSHLARNTTDRTTDVVSVQQANVFNLECFYRSSQTDNTKPIYRSSKRNSATASSMSKPSINAWM